MNKHIIWLSLDLALCVWPLREHNTALTLVLCDVILCVCVRFMLWRCDIKGGERQFYWRCAHSAESFIARPQSLSLC